MGRTRPTNIGRTVWLSQPLLNDVLDFRAGDLDDHNPSFSRVTDSQTYRKHCNGFRRASLPEIAWAALIRRATAWCEIEQGNGFRARMLVFNDDMARKFMPVAHSRHR